jgi:hypothetical protein
MFIKKSILKIWDKMVIVTNTPYTSINPYQLPLAFTLFFYLERMTNIDY